MLETRNSSGKPLTGSAWLEAHHRAKLAERHAYALRLAALRPSRVLDLGCATGLWLDVLDGLLPNNCEFIGFDADAAALSEAAERAKRWSRPFRFEQVDLGTDRTSLPEADLTLLFNMSAYLDDLDDLLRLIARRSGALAIRQYDGAALRFGPLPTEHRSMIEMSLRTAVERSAQFKHYALDPLFEALERAPFDSRDVSFELFARTSPFPVDFEDYFWGTMRWTLDYLSEAAGESLRSWCAARQLDPSLPSYFVEFDLTAMLS